MKKRIFFGKKAALEKDMIGYWIIGLAVLGLVIGGYIVIKGNLGEYTEAIKNLFKFGG